MGGWVELKAPILDGRVKKVFSEAVGNEHQSSDLASESRVSVDQEGFDVCNRTAV